jgi:hypothetical protein
VVVLTYNYVENVFPGSSLRSASKLQEETSKGHIFVVIFNISLIQIFKRFHYFVTFKLATASHVLQLYNV